MENEENYQSRVIGRGVGSGKEPGIGRWGVPPGDTNLAARR